MTNQDVIDQLKKAAAVLEVTDTSPQKVFRIRAYQNAIESLENLDEDLKEILARGSLDDVQGVGKELSQKITEIITSGRSPAIDKLLRQVPQGMFPLLEIPGVGPKRAYRLATEFKLDNPSTAVPELKAIVARGDVAKLEGFGDKSAADLQENLERLKPKATRMTLDQADALAARVLDLIKPLPGVINADVLGSLRRRQDTIGDVDIAVVTRDTDQVLEALRSVKAVKKITAAGENLIRLVLADNKQVDLKFQIPEKYGATLQHFTGNKAHNIALRELAIKQGKSLSEHGIKLNGEILPFKDEITFYANLGLDWIPPEIRDNEGEIAAAKTHRLPDLVNRRDVRGDYHTHTDFTWRSSHDYGPPVKDLLDQADVLGYEWLGIGDHNPSQSAYTAKELTTLVAQRQKHIEQEYYSWKRLHPTSTLNILTTLEVDILPDGNLALADAALAPLDFCIVSVHSRFTLPPEQQTARILQALSHPKVKILGHPTGRIINERPPMNVSWDRVFAECKKRQIAVEINAHPRRLDLPDSLVREALKHGVLFSLGTDAHEASSLDLMSYGLSVARRGWVSKRDIINAYSFAELRKWLALKP